MALSTLAAQDTGHTLHLIQASPYPFVNDPFPATLFAVGEGPVKLKEIREVADKSVDSVHINYDAGLATIVVRNELGIGIGVIDFSHPSVESLLQFEYGGRSALDSFLISHPSLGMLQTLDLSPLHENIDSSARLLPRYESRPGYLLLSLALGQLELSSPKVQEIGFGEYAYLRLGGDAQPGIAGDNAVLQVLADGTIGMRHVSTESSFGVKAPTTFVAAGSNPIILGSVCSDDLLVVSRREDRIAGSRGLGTALIYAFNKHNQQWRAIKVPGNAPWTRGFGPWVAIMVAESTRGVIPSPLAKRKVVTGLELQNEEFAKRKRFKPSPGMTTAESEPRDTGVPVRDRFQDLEIYSPGTLIVYDTRTGKQATLETNFGDSEILLVSEGVVIYRVDRSIYSAKYDGTSITEGRVLVEDDAILDVHWAFWGLDGKS